MGTSNSPHVTTTGPSRPQSSRRKLITATVGYTPDSNVKQPAISSPTTDASSPSDGDQVEPESLKKDGTGLDYEDNSSVYFDDENSCDTVQTRYPGSPPHQFKISSLPDEKINVVRSPCNNGAAAIQARSSKELLQVMNVMFDEFGAASQKFVEFIRRHQGDFNEFQQAVSKVSQFASQHHGQFHTNSELARLIGYARGSHANHAYLTAIQIPGMIEQYRQLSRFEEAVLGPVRGFAPTTGKSVSPRTPQPYVAKSKQSVSSLDDALRYATSSSDHVKAIAFTPEKSSSKDTRSAAKDDENTPTKSNSARKADSDNCESTSKSARSSYLSASSSPGSSKPIEYDFFGKRPVLKHGSRYLRTSSGQIDQQTLLKLKFKHKEDGSIMTYDIDPPSDWTDRKQVNHAQKIAQQYVARKSGATRDEKRPAYEDDDTQWIVEYMTAKTKLTASETGGIDWKKLSQKSRAVKQVTADYNARECVASGERPRRTEIALFQKITRMFELRPLRGMPEKPLKRKSFEGPEDNDDEPVAKRNKSDAEGLSDVAGPIDQAAAALGPLVEELLEMAGLNEDNMVEDDIVMKD